VLCKIVLENSFFLAKIWAHRIFCFNIVITCIIIPFSATDTKKVLYEKIKQKKTPVVYNTDQIANLHGHEVLRTPVRHCELNPI
jgi:hypothetical protein